MAIERTLVLIKPPHSTMLDSVVKIINRYIEFGLRIIDVKEVFMKAELFHELYREHLGKRFFPLLQDAYCFERFIAVAFEGDNAVSVVRAINGSSDPKKADEGTLRREFGDFEPRTDGFTTPYNAVHGSDSAESAVRELKIFFPEM